jgi:putative transposase
MRAYSNWRWHLEGVFVKVDGETHCPWRLCNSKANGAEKHMPDLSHDLGEWDLKQ